MHLQRQSRPQCVDFDFASSLEALADDRGGCHEPAHLASIVRQRSVDATHFGCSKRLAQLRWHFHLGYAPVLRYWMAGHAVVGAMAHMFLLEN